MKRTLMECLGYIIVGLYQPFGFTFSKIASLLLLLLSETKRISFMMCVDVESYEYVNVYFIY